MDLPGASYFYTLAQIGITFSGFAALLMALRQMRGSDLTKFQLWVTRAYVQSGLVTAMNAMLSPLLYGLGLSVDMTWQVASALVAVQSLVLIGMVPKQWREATNRPMDGRVKAHIGCGLLINAMLLMNAVGWPFPPMGGLVMFAISWNLFAFFAQFARSIDCLVPKSRGAKYHELRRDSLWDKFFTAAPRRLGRSVERYNIVKRA